MKWSQTNLFRYGDYHRSGTKAAVSFSFKPNYYALRSEFFKRYLALLVNHQESSATDKRYLALLINHQECSATDKR